MREPEIIPYELTVFGVKIFSRYGLYSETIQMMEFVSELHTNGLSELVKELFYDSNCSTCNFTFYTDFEKISPGFRKGILDIALKHLAQFEWNGDMKHSWVHEMAEAKYLESLEDKGEQK